jgi:hypothetical protein
MLPLPYFKMVLIILLTWVGWDGVHPHEVVYWAHGNDVLSRVPGLMPHGRLRLGGSQFEASLHKQFVRSISKITRAKWTRGVAQAVEYLLCNCEAEFKTSVPPKKTKKCDKWWPLLLCRLCHTCLYLDLESPHCPLSISNLTVKVSQ